MDLYKVRKQDRDKTLKKVTLLQNNGRKEKQEEYPTSEMYHLKRIKSCSHFVTTFLTHSDACYFGSAEEPLESKNSTFRRITDGRPFLTCPPSAAG